MQTYTFILKTMSAACLSFKAGSLQEAWDLLGKRLGYGPIKSWSAMIKLTVPQNKARFRLVVTET